MSNAKFLSDADVTGLVGDLLAAGTAVVAPVAHGEAREYGAVDKTKAKQVKLTGPMPRRSLKEHFLPATEPLLRWKQRGSQVELEEVPTTFGPRVILGARPCDAAAVEAVDRLMSWDYRDELWFGRRQATTIVSLACPGFDASCFCTAVGLSPDATRGSDVMLVPVAGGYLAEALTDQGHKLLAANPKRFADPKSGAEAEADKYRKAARDKVSANLKVSPERIRGWLEEHFDDSLWNGLPASCHGCGACAAMCPTCHCFDIVDEPERYDHGTRRRNWDTCQTAKFTLHASGHNPRANQNARMRQRVMHKFRIYPKRFEGMLLCTGCGRCTRFCGGGMDLLDILAEIDRRAAAGAPAGGRP